MFWEISWRIQGPNRVEKKSIFWKFYFSNIHRNQTGYGSEFSEPKHSAIERSRRVDIKNTQTFWKRITSHRFFLKKKSEKSKFWIFRRKSSKFEKISKFSIFGFFFQKKSMTTGPFSKSFGVLNTYSSR